MKLTKLAAGVGLAITLAAFSPIVPAAMAQSAGNSYRSSTATNNPANQSGAWNTTNANASWSTTGNNSLNENGQQGPRAEAKHLKKEIYSARRNGVDVVSANYQYRLGVREMHRGNPQLAMKHFQEARNDLTSEQDQHNNGSAKTQNGTMNSASANNRANPSAMNNPLTTNSPSAINNSNNPAPNSSGTSGSGNSSNGTYGGGSGGNQ